MTIDQLIQRLTDAKGRIGGDCEVKVVDGEGEWGFALTSHLVPDEKSETGVTNLLLLDITAEPE